MKAEAAGNGGAEPKQAPVPDPQLQEPTEEEREQREAEFEEQLRMRVVRSDLVGRDRHFRRYWWLQGVVSALAIHPASACSPPIHPASFPEMHASVLLATDAYGQQQLGLASLLP